MDWIRLRTTPRSSQPAPRRPADDTVFWLFHVPSTYVETRSWVTTALVLGIFLLAHMGSRIITGGLTRAPASACQSRDCSTPCITPS
jgi:hypothetical protein